VAKKKTSGRKKAMKKPARTTARKAAKQKAPGRKQVAKRAAKPAAAGPHATPYICCKGAAAALDFYKKAFGAEETMRISGTDGSVGHAEICIEGASIMLSDEAPDLAVFSPHTIGGSPVAMYLYVPDVDEFVLRAIDGGASVLDPVSDRPYGDRAGTLRDPFGHRWFVATKQEAVSKSELQKRFGREYKVT
jgi:PhnB protein